MSKRSSCVSPADCQSWLQRVHQVQHQKLTPEAREMLQRKVEEQRSHEMLQRKCKAVKSHAKRSSALASEGLRQMAASVNSEDFVAAQERWQCAQQASESRQSRTLCMLDRSSAPAAAMGGAARRCEPQVSEVLRSAEMDDEEAVAEVTALVGCATPMLLAAEVSSAGQAPLPLPAPAAAPGRGMRARGGPGGRGQGQGQGNAANGDDAVLEQLKKEPRESAECAAKFALYEGYAGEVEKMRHTLLDFYAESLPSVPQAVGADMQKQIKGIDSNEAMSVPDDARVWFVYHMMRQAKRNNLSMATVLESFEKKLDLLSNCQQSECPVCLEDFTESGPQCPETLSCCHKVCQECWEHWSSVMSGRPFCPLCRNDDFLGAVASRVARQ